MNRRVFGAAVVAATLAATGEARATLTPSETEQVRQWVATAQPANAARVRALVARPDLSADDAAAAMTSALVAVPFDDGRAAFVHEVLFGGASAASRPVLVPAVVRGVVARADAVLAQHAIDLDRSPATLAEAWRAYSFVEEVAAADATSNVTDSARDACLRAMADHAKRNAAVLGADAQVSPAVARVRAQAAIAILDLTPDQATRFVDAADKIGLAGARREALVRAGLLVLDSGGSDAAARIDRIRAFVDRMPGLHDGVEAVFVGVDPRGLRARGAVVAIADVPSAPLGAATSPWRPDAEPPPLDTTTFAIARGLATTAVRRGLDRLAELRVQVDRDGDETQIDTMATMLLLDAPRTVSVAAARLLAGHPDTAARMSDALGALAVFGSPGEAKEGLVLSVGKPRGDGGTSALRATHVALAPNGAVTAFRLDGHFWRVLRADSGTIAMHRDGAPVTAAATQPGGAGSEINVTAGPTWTYAGLKLKRLLGVPMVGVDGDRLRFVSAQGFDVVTTAAPGDDVAVEADLTPHDGAAGLVVRATASKKNFRGVWIAVTPQGRAQIVTADGAGHERTEVDVALPARTTSAHVTIVVRGASVEATVAGVPLKAALGVELSHGDVGFRASPGSSLEASGLSVLAAPAGH